MSNQAQSNHIIITSQHPAAQLFAKSWINRHKAGNKNSWSNYLPPNYTHIIMPYLPVNLDFTIFWVEITKDGVMMINKKVIKP